MSRRPNFFIVGAPKCGTTALSAYLRDHPNAFVSRPKEPHYFSADFDYYYAPGRRTEEHYLRLFEGAGEEHVAVGEASVWYLHSAAAIPGIRVFAPDARIIVMVRNPVDMVPSLHSQLRYTLDEDRDDVEEAWRLQEARRRGERLPATVRVPEFLQYRRAASLGRQLERVYESFPREQVRVIVFDDLRDDPARVHRETLEFLGLPDDRRADFPRVNENKVHRDRRLARVTQRPPSALVGAVRAAKRLAGVERLGLLDRVRRGNRAVVAREAVSPEFAAELRAAFRDDVALLGSLIGRDLGHWTA